MPRGRTAYHVRQMKCEGHRRTRDVHIKCRPDTAQSFLNLDCYRGIGPLMMGRGADHEIYIRPQQFGIPDRLPCRRNREFGLKREFAIGALIEARAHSGMIQYPFLFDNVSGVQASGLRDEIFTGKRHFRQFAQNAHGILGLSERIIGGDHSSLVIRFGGMKTPTPVMPAMMASVRPAISPNAPTRIASASLEPFGCRSRCGCHSNT